MQNYGIQYTTSLIQHIVLRSQVDNSIWYSSGSVEGWE